MWEHKTQRRFKNFNCKVWSPFSGPAMYSMIQLAQKNIITNLTHANKISKYKSTIFFEFI